MPTVFVNMGISLDGYIAGPNRGPRNPLGDQGMQVHEWMFHQQAFLDNLKLSGKGETGPDNDRIKRTVARIGANVMGKRMFEEGEANWPEEAPFHNSVFVLTKEKRAAWVRPGGTTFYFVNGGIDDALKRAKKAAGAKDVRISGGANVVQQYLNAGLVDAVELAISPMILGEGLRLWDGVDRKRVHLEVEEATDSPLVTHVRYKVRPVA
jgi:dihydrofolate reductase